MCVFFFVEFCVLIPIFNFLKNIEHKLFCYDNQHNAIQRIIFYLKNENVYHAFLVLGIKQSLDSVINKWKKLKQQCKTHLDKKRKSGTERRRNWKFAVIRTHPLQHVCSIQVWKVYFLVCNLFLFHQFEVLPASVLMVKTVRKEISMIKT